METRRRYPAGVQDFETIIQERFVYVDKTHYIYDLANNYGNAIFLSRPRRFGKSMLCSTMKYYFTGRHDLFEGLAIGHLERRWPRHPVLQLSMANVKSRDPEVVASNICALLRRYEATYGSDPANTTLSTQVSKSSVVIRPLLTDELQPAELDAFLSVGFTNHYEILAHSKGADECLFYILHMSSCHTRTHPSASFFVKT